MSFYMSAYMHARSKYLSNKQHENMRMRKTKLVSTTAIKISNCQMDKINLPGGEHCEEKRSLAFYISCIFRSCSDYLFTLI